MVTRIIRGGDRLQAELAGIGKSLRGNIMQRLLSRVMGRMKALPSLRVGFFEAAKYPDGTPVAAVAAYNEFGTPRIPPRPFMRETIERHQHEWPRLLAAVLKMTGGDIDKAIEIVAEKIVSQIQDSIREGTYDPNAAVTNLLKYRFPKREQSGMTAADVWKAMRDVKNGVTAPAGRPLDWTGDMLQHVSSEVSDD